MARHGIVEPLLNKEAKDEGGNYNVPGETYAPKGWTHGKRFGQTFMAGSNWGEITYIMA